jgi:hypothetical protein
MSPEPVARLVGVGADPESRIVAHAWEHGSPGTLVTATGNRDQAQMEAATADLIEALDGFNRVLNGPRPSSGLRDACRTDVVPIRVAYSVGEAVRMLRESGATTCAWRIETAWLAVLAQDIDDVSNHVAEEEQARS